MEWEYRKFVFDNRTSADFSEHELNELGRKKWELVSHSVVHGHTFYIFKRPK